MKKILLLLVLVFSAAIVFAQKIEPRPHPPKAVNDFANMLTPSERAALEQKLDTYNDTTSSAIVIITVPDLQGYDISQVSLAYLRGWGVGVKGKNNGIILLVAKQERKVRIETGYGMEGPIPDITAKHIIEKDITPNFKNGDYYGGLNSAVDDIIKAAAGEFQQDQQQPKDGSGSGVAVIVVIVGVILIIIFLSGRGGGGGGQYMSRRGSRSFLDALPWFLMGNMMGRGGGGGFGGGGFGGGGFGGGGFGGFGGGSGGGGGASGGW